MFKRWMVFVDGENLTIRAQELAEKEGKPLVDQASFPFYRRDVYFWPRGLLPNQGKFIRAVPQLDFAERSYYYTCIQGDDPTVEEVHDSLQGKGFSPVVVKKIKGQRAKGVDISLTKDMLVQAFFNNFDVAILVAGDGDFVPVVQEIKHFGKRVVVAFFDEQSGLSPQLRRAADEYYPLQLIHG